MPIYEFYCSACHCLYQFFTSRVNTRKKPSCPVCGRRRLERQISAFSIGSGGGREESAGTPEVSLNEDAMERAMMSLAAEAEGMNEEDPRQAAALMRKFSSMTGLSLGDGMQEAMSRLEAGEDPDAVEAEMGELLESEDPLQLSPKGLRQREKTTVIRSLRRDETLYDL